MSIQNENVDSSAVDAEGAPTKVLRLRQWSLSNKRVTIELTHIPRGADGAERLISAVAAFVHALDGDVKSSTATLNDGNGLT